jgi:hypothetical protein
LVLQDLFAKKKSDPTGSNTGSAGNSQTGSGSNSVGNMSSSGPRGLKVNNPGNIRTNAYTWPGEIKPSADPAFKQFVSPEYGYRGLAALLYEYVTQDGHDTLRKIIHVYAPADDGNNPDSYSAFVSKNSGVALDTKLTAEDFKWPRQSQQPNALKIMRYMVRVEQGQLPDETKLEGGYQIFLNGHSNLS